MTEALSNSIPTDYSEKKKKKKTKEEEITLMPLSSAIETGQKLGGKRASNKNRGGLGRVRAQHAENT